MRGNETAAIMEKPANALAIESLEFQDSGDEVLVHDRMHGKVHVLNRAAAKVLRLCDATHDVDSLACAVAGQADERARADVARIIEQFRSLGLLVAR